MVKAKQDGIDRNISELLQSVSNSPATNPAGLGGLSLQVTAAYLAWLKKFKYQAS